MRRTGIAISATAWQRTPRDPHFARAYVGLAMAHLNEWACFSWNHWFFLHQEALELARKAVELDDRDHRAHCILGLARLYGHDYEGARRQLLRALELNPNDADVLAHASVAMALIGDHDLAVETGRSALRLAPHHPEWYAAFAGIALFVARLHDEAIATMAPAPEALCHTPAFIAASYAHLGRLEECAAHRETVYRHHRRPAGARHVPRRHELHRLAARDGSVSAACGRRALRRWTTEGRLRVIAAGAAGSRLSHGFLRNSGLVRRRARCSLLWPAWHRSLVPFPTRRGFVRQPRRRGLVQRATGLGQAWPDVLEPALRSGFAAALGFVRSRTMDERWPDDGRLGVEFHGLRRQCGTEVDRLLGLERLERLERAPELGHRGAAIAVGQSAPTSEVGAGSGHRVSNERLPLPSRIRTSPRLPPAIWRSANSSVSIRPAAPAARRRPRSAAPAQPARLAPRGDHQRRPGAARAHGRQLLDQRRLELGELGSILVREHAMLLCPQAVLQRVLCRAGLAFEGYRATRLGTIATAGFGTSIADRDGRAKRFARSGLGVAGLVGNGAPTPFRPATGPQPRSDLAILHWTWR
jgi:hypothetical protein